MKTTPTRYDEFKIRFKNLCKRDNWFEREIGFPILENIANDSGFTLWNSAYNFYRVFVDDIIKSHMKQEEGWFNEELYFEKEKFLFLIGYRKHKDGKESRMQLEFMLDFPRTRLVTKPKDISVTYDQIKYFLDLDKYIQGQEFVKNEFLKEMHYLTYSYYPYRPIDSSWEKHPEEFLSNEFNTANTSRLWKQFIERINEFIAENDQPPLGKDKRIYCIRKTFGENRGSRY
jgi:hypothetical protein